MTTLGLFMKQPVPGQVKTRLGAEIGMEAAARLAEAFHRDLIARTAGLADRRILAYSPADESSQAYFRRWERRVKVLWPQPDSNLGERLLAFFDRWCENQQPVVAVRSDSPTIPRELIGEAFVRLSSCDCVIGPAVDGGYYLIGLKNPLPVLFKGIDWSGSRVLEQTVGCLADANMSLSLLSPWYEVNSLQDLGFLRGHLEAMRLADMTVDLPKETMERIGLGSGVDQG